MLSPSIALKQREDRLSNSNWHHLIKPFGIGAYTFTDNLSRNKQLYTTTCQFAHKCTSKNYELPPQKKTFGATITQLAKTYMYVWPHKENEKAKISPFLFETKSIENHAKEKTKFLNQFDQGRHRISFRSVSILQQRFSTSPMQFVCCVWRILLLIKKMQGQWHPNVTQTRERK